MKSITSHFAQVFPKLSLEEFAEKYIKQHPAGDRLSPDNIRQGFAEYCRYCRKHKRNRAKKDES